MGIEEVVLAGLAIAVLNKVFTPPHQDTPKTPEPRKISF